MFNSCINRQRGHTGTAHCS